MVVDGGSWNRLESCSGCASMTAQSGWMSLGYAAQMLSAAVGSGELSVHRQGLVLEVRRERPEIRFDFGEVEWCAGIGACGDGEGVERTFASLE